MPHHHYPSDPPRVSDEPLTAQAVSAIGRIVRAAAEFEHCITCFIVMLAETSETKAHIFLGRTPLSNRIETAKHLASIRDDDAIKAFTGIVTPDFLEAIRCRNAISHGAYIGKATSGQFMFLTDNKTLDENNKFGATVVGYSEETLSACAERIEQTIPYCEKYFQIESLRGKYLRQALRPHRKSRKQTYRAKAQKRPPGS